MGNIDGPCHHHSNDGAKYPKKNKEPNVQCLHIACVNIFFFLLVMNKCFFFFYSSRRFISFCVDDVSGPKKNCSCSLSFFFFGSRGAQIPTIYSFFSGLFLFFVWILMVVQYMSSRVFFWALVFVFCQTIHTQVHHFFHCFFFVVNSGESHFSSSSTDAAAAVVIVVDDVAAISVLVCVCVSVIARILVLLLGYPNNKT